MDSTDFWTFCVAVGFAYAVFLAVIFK